MARVDPKEVARQAAETIGRRRDETPGAAGENNALENVKRYASEAWQRIRTAAGHRGDAGQTNRPADDRAGRGERDTSSAMAARSQATTQSLGGLRNGGDERVAAPPTRPTPSSPSGTDAAHKRASVPGR